MPLFRSRDADPRGWTRFAPGPDRFLHTVEAGIHVVRVAAIAERSVDLFHALTEQLPAEVDLALRCLRTGREWTGERLPRPEVRDVLARLRVPLAERGGVELSAYAEEDQLTLSPTLDLWCHGRSDRWVYLLLALGLEEAPVLPERGWTIAAGDFTGGASVIEAVEWAASHLTLQLR